MGHFVHSNEPSSGIITQPSHRPSRIVPDMKYLWVPERYYKLWAY
jgi:hypothetical protein